jgi:hypothetical protein
MTELQLKFVAELRSFRPDAIVEAGPDEFSEDGAAVVNMIEDGGHSACWVDREGNLIGSWL